MRCSRNAAKSRLIDGIAARQVDEERVRLHPRQRRLPDQVLGPFIGDRKADDEVGLAQEIVELHVLNIGVIDGRKGIGDQNLRAQHLGDSGKVAAENAEAAVGQLPIHDDRGLAPGMIVGTGARNAARQIDHEADCQFRHRLDEAGAGLRDQHAGARSCIDTDVADLDRATDEGAPLGQSRKNLVGSGRESVGDDDIDVISRRDQVDRIQRRIGLVQPDAA
jgi:hypothetical protein